MISEKTPLNKLTMDFDLIPAGKINYMDPESEDAPFVIAKCTAIQVQSFEKGAETFYWEKEKLKSVSTGD